MPRGGKRAGAGRPLRFEGAKEHRSVVLSPRAWAFIAWIAMERECSDSEALEHIIRTHIRFRPEQQAASAAEEE